ncbi:MAG: SPFH domain-containing protein [Parcubacteria group bacterium]|nr:SPFH domain-containing protein [Parcubacteria group bacterium]
MKAVIATVAAGIALFLLCMALWLTGILPSAHPTAGEETVLIRKPIIFGDGGIDPVPVKAGRKLLAWTTQRVNVDMRPQQFVAHFDDFMSNDGVPLDFDAVIRLQVLDSVRIIEKFGPDWYKNNVAAEFNNRIRQAVRKHGMNEVAIETTAIDAIDTEVSLAMETYIKDAGIPIRLVQVTIGKANPPDAVKTQRIETATQQQAILTQQQRKLAEDQRKAAEQSRAEADKAYQKEMGLTTEQFVMLEWLKAFRGVCEGGKCTVVTQGAATPVVNVGR